MPDLTRRNFLVCTCTAVAALIGVKVLTAFGSQGDWFSQYVQAVTSGEGFLPGQERQVSEQERLFREHIEARKTRLLERSHELQSTALFSAEDFRLIKKTIQSSAAGEKSFFTLKERADYLINQPTGYVERMIPELTPTNGYGLTCPHCVGGKSQEGHAIYEWNFRQPEFIVCRSCGQTYPSPNYPETARLVCPRSNQTFTFYLNEAERLHPHDRSGKYAYKWAKGWPIHMSFSGLIRMHKIKFMISAANNLAIVYRITGDKRYARMSVDIQLRLTQCYRHWLYHDYRDTFADCDPLYAAWHDQRLPLEWKRHLCTAAYSKDSTMVAAMLHTYWGAGRIWPGTDAITTYLPQITMAYDLTRGSSDASGKPLWDAQSRDRIERDLILEYLMGSEPFLGGSGKADNWSNKAPGVYYAMAIVGRSLQVPAFLETSLLGYRNVLHHAFLPDGSSRQSPWYTDMYLRSLVKMPQLLNNCHVLHNSQKLHLQEANEQLQRVYATVFAQLRPDGTYFPLGDTQIGEKPAWAIIEAAHQKNAYPAESGELGLLTEVLGPRTSPESATEKSEVYFPAWMTAILRHQVEKRKAALAFSFSPAGIHRHRDNLSLFYEDGGDIILGDHGYFGTSPLNRWMKSTYSHNLVIVDNQEQNFKERRPSLHRMLTSPKVSVVEASSGVYSQCSEYKRLLALFKEPAGSSFVLDIFRVKGGNIHDYRIFSEIGCSDDDKGGLELAGLNVPAFGKLAKGSAKLTESEIFGLKDPFSHKNPPPAWQAVWKGRNRSYRLWLLSPVDEVIVSSGPGQETKSQARRRVRYLDAVRKGKGIESTIIALHEPLHNNTSGPIKSVERLQLATNAGEQALALHIRTQWGTYLILNHFNKEIEVQGMKFKGNLGILGLGPDGNRWILGSEAETLKYGSLGFSSQAAKWAGSVTEYTKDRIVTSSNKPAQWPDTPSDCQNYVVISGGDYQTGYPASSTEDNAIRLAQFPLTAARHFILPSFYFIEGNKGAKA